MPWMSYRSDVDGHPAMNKGQNMSNVQEGSGATWQQGSTPGWQQGVGVVPAGTVGTPTDPGRQILLTIVTLGIWAAVWTYRQHRDIKDFSGEGVGSSVGLVIYIFVGIVTPFLLANEVQTKLYEKAGQTSPVNTATGAWALLPIVGGLIWYLRVQRALNEFWTARGATAAA